MARDLDKIADVLPTVVTKKRKPITPFILDLIKKKRQLRRQKNLAHNDIGRMQKIQREMNLIGNQIKKEQEREKKVQLEAACQTLSNENDPRKFFKSVNILTDTSSERVALTKKIKDELGNTHVPLLGLGRLLKAH